MIRKHIWSLNLRMMPIKNYGRNRGTKELHSKKMGRSRLTCPTLFQTGGNFLSSDHAPLKKIQFHIKVSVGSGRNPIQDHL